MMEQIELVPQVFDILYLDGETLMDRPLAERRKALDEVLRTHVAPQFPAADAAAAEAIYAEALDLGHEGIMVKVFDSPYTPGVRGRLWVKVKPGVETLDLVRLVPARGPGPGPAPPGREGCDRDHGRGAGRPLRPLQG
jgi:DNA ligase-1